MTKQNEATKRDQSISKKRGNISIQILLAIISAIIAIVVCVLYISQFKMIPKIAYVDTGKLMIGFSESNKIQKELKEEDDKWRSKLKEMEDSLKAYVDRMSNEYNKANAAKKRELQDILSAQNQQVNNFKQANMKKMEKLHQEKMQSVLDKINVYISEYGKKKGFSIIFGTVAGGSILYGDEDYYDITEEIVNGLNERYK